MFTIIITETSTEATPHSDVPKREIERYRQTTDDLDLPAIVALVNRPKRKQRADAGKSREKP